MKNVVMKLFFVAVLSVLATSHAFSQSNQQDKETKPVPVNFQVPIGFRLNY